MPVRYLAPTAYLQWEPPPPPVHTHTPPPPPPHPAILRTLCPLPLWALTPRPGGKEPGIPDLPPGWLASLGSFSEGLCLPSPRARRYLQALGRRRKPQTPPRLKSPLPRILGRRSGLREGRGMRQQSPPPPGHSGPAGAQGSPIAPSGGHSASEGARQKCRAADTAPGALLQLGGPRLLPLRGSPQCHVPRSPLGGESPGPRRGRGSGRQAAPRDPILAAQPPCRPAGSSPARAPCLSAPTVSPSGPGTERSSRVAFQPREIRAQTRRGAGGQSPPAAPGTEAHNAHSPRGRGARSPGLPRAARGVPLAPASGGRRTRGLREGSGPKRPQNVGGGAPGGTGGTRPRSGTEETRVSPKGLNEAGCTSHPRGGGPAPAPCSCLRVPGTGNPPPSAGPDLGGGSGPSAGLRDRGCRPGSHRHPEPDLGILARSPPARTGSSELRWPGARQWLGPVQSPEPGVSTRTETWESRLAAPLLRKQLRGGGRERPGVTPGGRSTVGGLHTGDDPAVRWDPSPPALVGAVGRAGARGAQGARRAHGHGRARAPARQEGAPGARRVEPPGPQEARPLSSSPGAAGNRLPGIGRLRGRQGSIREVPARPAGSGAAIPPGT